MDLSVDDSKLFLGCLPNRVSVVTEPMYRFILQRSTFLPTCKKSQILEIDDCFVKSFNQYHGTMHQILQLPYPTQLTQRRSSILQLVFEGEGSTPLENSFDSGTGTGTQEWTISRSIRKMSALACWKVGPNRNRRFLQTDSGNSPDLPGCRWWLT